MALRQDYRASFWSGGAVDEANTVPWQVVDLQSSGADGEIKDGEELRSA